MREQTHIDVDDEHSLLLVFSRRLNRLLDRHGYSKVQNQRAQRLATEFDVSLSGTRNWLIARAIPSPGSMKKIALRLNTSIDYLLGITDNTTIRTPGATISNELISIPVYVLGKQNRHLQSDSVLFEQTREVWFSPREGELKNSDFFFIESWIDLRNPSVRKGDLLLIDSSERYLTENGIYILCTQAMVCIRRINTKLDGQIEMVVGYGDRTDTDYIRVEDIMFNEGVVLKEINKTGIKIIGRVVAKIVKLDRCVDQLL